MHLHTEIEKGEMRLAVVGSATGLPIYPIDMNPFFALMQITFNETGAPVQEHTTGHHPAIIAQYALSQWNQYLIVNDERHCQIFLTQALWLVEHEIRIDNDAGGWPIDSPHPDARKKCSWLSAVVQGNVLSVLVRAYLLTQDDVFLAVAHRAAGTFHRDILDGGVSAPLGMKGISFEEVAVYPASHRLEGFFFGLLGLYDYVQVASDPKTKSLISRSLVTLHDLLTEFDIGFWTYSDLLHHRLSSSSELALRAALLDAISKYSGCNHCSSLALRWKNYRYRYWSRLRYPITNNCARFGYALLVQIRTHLFNDQVRRTTNNRGKQKKPLHVCVPIHAFPVTGGVRSVLSKIAQTTQDIWQLEYLTQYVGPHSDEFIIHRFGTGKTAPWQFPAVWLYFIAGFWKLVSLLRSRGDFDLILLQDGVYTAAFGSLAAKVAGVRSVCIDHGNLSLLKSKEYRAERIKALSTTNWSLTRRLFARLLYLAYWPSLYFLAWLGARFVDHYFIPGIHGDGVENICKELGVQPSHITRFANMIDIDRHILLDASVRATAREKLGIAADAVVIAIICRLAPEKGLEVALEAIQQALSSLSPEKCKRLRVIIAGDGPLRKQLEEDIFSRGLSQTCLLWGEASVDEVIELLSLSDIFLFTSWRAAGYPLSILEAMASGCAVIASTESKATERMLAEGRGVVLPVGDADMTGRALVQLVSNPELRRQMGYLARSYVKSEHSANAFRRNLMRVTSWSALNELLNDKKYINSLELNGESN